MHLLANTPTDLDAMHFWSFRCESFDLPIKKAVPDMAIAVPNRVNPDRIITHASLDGRCVHQVSIAYRDLARRNILISILTQLPSL